MSSETFLYLTTRGRKTGMARRIEIWFVELSNCFYLVAESRERAQWVKNLLAWPEVQFSVGTRSDSAGRVPVTRARARIVDAHSEPELSQHVRQLMDDRHGWSDGLIVELAPLATYDVSTGGTA
jgi:deazaflavin-dependent oxidoreductase (nitroreductase family)